MKTKKILTIFIILFVQSINPIFLYSFMLNNNVGILINQSTIRNEIPTWFPDSFVINSLSSDWNIPPKNKFSRQAAYGYALQWWNGRNSHYNDFSGSGGDCSNFVSQCLIAGGLSLHNGTDGNGYGIYPDTDRPATLSYGCIVYCDYLNLHLRNFQNTTVTYVTNTNSTVPEYITVGDVLIFGNKSGDRYEHAMIVVWDGGSDLGLAAHTTDVWNRSFTEEISYFSCSTFYHFNQENAEYYHFRVTTSTLNVRVGAGKNTLDNYYQDIGDIHDEEEYIAFEYELDENSNKWWHFWFDDRAAWCSASFTENVTANQPFQVNVSTVLNVRDDPGTSYPIFGQVYNEMRFVCSFNNGSWSRFWYSGSQKYSHSSYLDDLTEFYWKDTGKTCNKTVFGFLPYWVSTNQNWTPLTHLAWFSAELNANGSIGATHGWPNSAPIDEVHAAGKKIILTATMFDNNDIHTLISTTSYINTAVGNLLNLVQNANADGICIDFEHPTSSGDDAYLINFMDTLNNTFKLTNPEYHVSLCTPSVDWWGTYNYSGLSHHLDAFFLMGYGYYYSGSSNAGPTAPLYGGSYNLNYSVYAHITKGAPRSKIILGLPFYGYDYPVVDESKQSSTRSSGASITYSSNIVKKNSQSAVTNYDTTYECEWYNYYEPSDGWHQVWCDTNRSLSVKMDYIIIQNLCGLGIWAWGYQGDNTGLENIIMKKFRADTTPPIIKITNPVANTEFTTNPVTITWNGSDNVEISHYNVSINNEKSWVNVGLNTSFTTFLQSGCYNITVVAFDTSNNTANASSSFSVNINNAILLYYPTNNPINSLTITIATISFTTGCIVILLVLKKK
ncbi:MAG: glycosyl hydrolase family 18 protein [Candidatus Helarchaeota archaeon]